MFKSLIKAIGGDPNKRDVCNVSKIVDPINPRYNRNKSVQQSGR